MTIRDLGLALVHNAPWLERLGRRAYALLPTSLHDTPTSRLAAFFAPDRQVAFIQIGAFDGIAGDPIRSLVIERCGWCGVLVEPQEDAFERLKQNYNDQAHRLQFVNAAVSSTSGEQTFFAISSKSIRALGLPDWAGEIASLDSQHIRRHFPSADIDVEARTIETLTFADVASRLPDEKVDLVVIDVEGHERTVIEDIDLDRHRVSFMLYEHKHLSDDDRSYLEGRLREGGFSVKNFGRDTIAWRR